MNFKLAAGRMSVNVFSASLWRLAACENRRLVSSRQPRGSGAETFVFGTLKVVLGTLGLFTGCKVPPGEGQSKMEALVLLTRRGGDDRDFLCGQMCWSGLQAEASVSSL